MLWPSAVVFALGFGLYFTSLAFTNSAAGVAGAICLIVLGVVIYVAAALHQHVDTIDADQHANATWSFDSLPTSKAEIHPPVIDTQPSTIATPVHAQTHQ